MLFLFMNHNTCAICVLQVLTGCGTALTEEEQAEVAKDLEDAEATKAAAKAVVCVCVYLFGREREREAG